VLSVLCELYLRCHKLLSDLSKWCQAVVLDNWQDPLHMCVCALLSHFIRERNKVSKVSKYCICILSPAPARVAWLIPKIADCGGDQCKSRQDQKRKQRPKSKGQTSSTSSFTHHPDVTKVHAALHVCTLTCLVMRSF